MTKGYFVDAYHVSNGVLIETSQCGADNLNGIISSFFSYACESDVFIFRFIFCTILKRNTNFVRLSSAIWSPPFTYIHSKKRLVTSKFDEKRGKIFLPMKKRPKIKILGRTFVSSFTWNTNTYKALFISHHMNGIIIFNLCSLRHIIL